MSIAAVTIMGGIAFVAGYALSSFLAGRRRLAQTHIYAAQQQFFEKMLNEAREENTRLKEQVMGLLP